MNKSLLLYVADARQAASLPLAAWFRRWEEAFWGADSNTSIHVMLIGFSQSSMVAWHRFLINQGIAPANCHTVLPDTIEALAQLDDALLHTAIKQMISALAPTRVIDIVGYTVRSCEFPEPVTNAPALPTLAFVSPLPPEPTGIASYSAELLPYLAKHFAVTLVVDQPEVDDELTREFSCIDPDTFSQHATEYDYTLYQIGNSLHHAYQFALLQQHPGLVVLHDYFLFDAVWWLQESGLKPGALCEQLYRDHGYPALVAQNNVTAGERGAEQYPVNGLAVSPAGGVVYHSEYGRSLARDWQRGIQAPTYLIPHLRQLPPWPDKSAARKALKVDAESFIIASFGGINSKKLTHLLVNTFLHTPALADRAARLVLVGAQHAGEYGHELERTIQQHPHGHRVTITGYTSRETYCHWLAAADMAVQLRTQSRGETSGAIFDAMAHGLPVIANAHGSNAELPERCVCLLPDSPVLDVLKPLLQDALVTLANDTAERSELSRAGRDYVATTLSPVAIAEQYRNAIHESRQQASRYRYERYLDALAGHSALRQAMQDKNDAQRLTRLLSELDTTPEETSPRLLFDISTIAWEDLKTGIERVTRRVADHLLRNPPDGWRVELIRWGGDDFYLARGFASQQLGVRCPGPDVPVEARAGDRYVSLEWAPPLLRQAGSVMQRMRACGVQFYFTVHDLLPLSLPGCFPEHIPGTMQQWFTAVRELADGLVCVSRETAFAVEAELSRGDVDARKHRPWVKHFHLGADFQPPAHSARNELSKAEKKWLQPLDRVQGPVLLMVGTIEPRKGHAQVLAALEQCWAKGVPLNLVIVGKQGWDVATLIEQIKCHPMRLKRLFWAKGASDALLNTLYQRSDALVAASLGEGFGLPLIEAAHHGIAILARDLPVFREVAGSHARYFNADTPQELCAVLTDWFADWQRGQVTASTGMPYLSWQQSAEEWSAAILSDQLPE
ncbi:glycosyltransferase [Halomonas piscis]|uniref:glycosyltransferase n=1 Tax=Halomonas piscis TaxID=3031727 RepID=UPI002896D036|nr:glycosyltransferase [Halomonas piscis]